MTSTRIDDSEWGFPNQATPVGSAVYYAVRFSPRSLRRCNALLYTWYQLIQDIAENPLDPGAARLKLDWWRQEVSNIPMHNARHPLAIALQESGLVASSTAIMDALIENAENEIRTGSPADDEAFVSCCRGSMGNLFRLLAEQENAAGVSLEPGSYCAAVERIRCIARSPHRVPRDLTPERLQKLDPDLRAERLEGLLGHLPGGSQPAVEPLPDFARRLTALSRAMHSRMRHHGYPVTNPPLDRAPIAHLWTAWRCR